MTHRLLLALLLLLAASCAALRPGAPARLTATVPTKEQVGAARLPADIAPVKAPFAVPQFRKPTFPAYTLRITERGARPGAQVTQPIQASIDEVSQRGGGTVVVPAGQWHTGRISLKSNVNLHFEDGAELYFSGEVADYRPAVFTRTEGVEVMSLGACIYANGQQNIAVTGRGRLIGPAQGGSVRRQTMTHDVVENVVRASTPVAQRVYEGHDGSIIFPPMFISPINCRGVYIEGVSLENTAFWNIVPVYCDGVIIRGVTVNSVGIQRGDGIDVESSRNVLIEYCTLSSGDDCFTIKAGRGEDGLRVNRPTENVVVRYCLAREGHGGITCGSETAAMIRNLYVHDCVFDNTGVGIRFKTRRPRGGGGENLTYERIRMNLKATAFHWDMLGSPTHVGGLADRLPRRPINALTPHFAHIRARDIVVEQASQFVKVEAIPEAPLRDVQLENLDVRAQKLFTAADVRGFTVRRATLRCPSATISLLDARQLLFDRVQFLAPGLDQPATLTTTVAGDSSATIEFRRCLPTKPAAWPAPHWAPAAAGQ